MSWKSLPIITNTETLFIFLFSYSSTTETFLGDFDSVRKLYFTARKQNQNQFTVYFTPLKIPQRASGREKVMYKNRGVTLKFAAHDSRYRSHSSYVSESFFLCKFWEENHTSIFHFSSFCSCGDFAITLKLHFYQTTRLRVLLRVSKRWKEGWLCDLYRYSKFLQTAIIFIGRWKTFLWMNPLKHAVTSIHFEFSVH